MHINYARAIVVALVVLAVRVDAQSASPSELVAALRLSNPHSRATAFQQLSRMRDGLSAPGVADALLASALEMEVNLVEATLRASNGTRGIADVYGEDFTEYVGQLTSECASRCDLTNPQW